MLYYLRRSPVGHAEESARDLDDAGWRIPASPEAHSLSAVYPDEVTVGVIARCRADGTDACRLTTPPISAPSTR